MSDPDVERELAANEARAAKKDDDDNLGGGIFGVVENALSFLRDDDVDPEDPAEIERRRRANDEAAR